MASAVIGVVESSGTGTLIPPAVNVAAVPVAAGWPEQSALVNSRTAVGKSGPAAPLTAGLLSLAGEAGPVAAIVGVAGGPKAAVRVRAWSATTSWLAAPPSDQAPKSYEVPARTCPGAETNCLEPWITRTENGEALVSSPTEIRKPSSGSVWIERETVFGSTLTDSVSVSPPASVTLSRNSR